MDTDDLKALAQEIDLGRHSVHADRLEDWETEAREDAARSLRDLQISANLLACELRAAGRSFDSWRVECVSDDLELDIRRLRGA